ncbi:MAG TPA: FecR domain-containing protein [Steroidobacteraceae bacterium]|jgi:transmembrane sensor|nr:FecR domain-containing protein [Steroidobacteraceae bacterium]
MVVQRKMDELLALRASEWFEVLPTATAEQLHELEAWLSASKLHVQEFLEIAEVEFALGGIDRSHQHDVDTLLQRVSSTVVPLPSRTDAAKSRRVPAWRNWKVAAMAASWAVLAVFASWMWSSSASTQEFTTAIGEHRVVQLADQSTVTMNAGSQIDVMFEKSAREIHLVQGEATFEVAHDTSRPFRVHTRAGIVTALGTKFNVLGLPNGDTRVSLLEGRVQIKSASQEMMMEAGQEVDIRVDGSFDPHPDAVVSNAIAWQMNRLVFQNAPLSEIVEAFNRQNRTSQLRLEGVDGAAHRLDGIFNANDPDALADLLSREPDLKAEYEGEDIVIRAKRR